MDYHFCYWQILILPFLLGDVALIHLSYTKGPPSQYIKDSDLILLQTISKLTSFQMKIHDANFMQVPLEKFFIM